MTLDSNLRGVHPVLAYRVEQLLAEPSLSRYSIYPAVRTRAKQEALYAKWKAGRGNLAANPNRTLRTGPEWPYDWTPKGSWHMVQGDGYGHAVDLKRPWNRSRAQARADVHPFLARYGLKATVASEFWHVQALTSRGWVPGPTPDGFDNLPKPKSELEQVGEYIAGLRQSVLRRRNRGIYVKSLQQFLLDKSYPVGRADGIFGRKTERAVREFQRNHGLVVDGIVGPNTWNALLS